jgi:hypothetical protein
MAFLQVAVLVLSLFGFAIFCGIFMLLAIRGIVVFLGQALHGGLGGLICDVRIFLDYIPGSSMPSRNACPRPKNAAWF